MPHESATRRLFASPGAPHFPPQGALGGKSWRGGSKEQAIRLTASEQDHWGGGGGREDSGIHGIQKDSQGLSRADRHVGYSTECSSDLRPRARNGLLESAWLAKKGI